MIEQTSTKKEQATFVFNARGDIRDLARIASVLEEEYQHRVSSRSEIVAMGLQILAEIFSAQDRGIPMPTITDAKEYFCFLGLDRLDSRKQTKKAIAEREADRVKKQNEELEEKNRRIEKALASMTEEKTKETLTPLQRIHKHKNTLKGGERK